MRFVENYVIGTEKSFRRMPRMTLVSVLSDFGFLFGTVGTGIGLLFNNRDFIEISLATLSVSLAGGILTRDYLYRLNRFDDNMRKFIEEKDMRDNYLQDEEFRAEARDYAKNHRIHDFELYLERNFRN